MAEGIAGTSTGSRGHIFGYLKRIKSSPVGQLIPIFDTPISIGREKESSICIPDPNVSRRHCTLFRSLNTFSINDLGGINGTYVDGVKLKTGKTLVLREGNCIHLGPPQEAAAGFVFFLNKPSDDPGSHSDSEPATKRKHCDSRPQRNPAECQYSDSDLELRLLPLDSDSDNSDYSICSLDSLRTRVLKKKRLSQKQSPAKSAKPAKCKEKVSSSLGSKALLDRILTDSEDSSKTSPASDSLLDLDNVFDDSYPFSLRLSKGSSNASSRNSRRTSGETKTNEQKQTLLRERNLQEALDKALDENKNLKEVIKEYHERSKTTVQKVDVKKLLDEELMCNICTEIFINPVTLGCAHTFCEQCIAVWQQKKKQCPMCRERIESERRLLIVENIIPKIHELVNDEDTARWKEVVAQREESKKALIPKRKTRRRSSNMFARRRRHRIRVNIPDILPLSPSRHMPTMAFRPTVSLTRLPALSVASSSSSATTSSHSTTTTSSELSDLDTVDMLCTLCGSRGHLARLCPF